MSRLIIFKERKREEKREKGKEGERKRVDVRELEEGEREWEMTKPFVILFSASRYDVALTRSSISDSVI